jgi:hypothetical protein
MPEGPDGPEIDVSIHFTREMLEAARPRGSYNILYDICLYYSIIYIYIYSYLFIY